MSNLKKSLGMSFLAQYAEIMIQFIGVMVLARMISAEDIGVYSVAAFVMTVLHVFRDFGVGKYLIKEEVLTPQKIRSTLGVAILLAWAVAVVMYLTRNLVADFYGNSQIALIMTVMSASFAISPLGSIYTSLFRRDMQFKKILVVRISSALGHVIVAVILALQGYGALSLAWANFAGILMFGIAAFSLRSPGTPWIPSFRHTREVLSFGSVSSIATLASVAGTNSSDMIIGKALSLAAAGYFSRANGLVQMFRTIVIGAVLPVVLPYFAELKRTGGDVNVPYRSAVEHLTVLAWPFFAVIAVLAHPIVHTLYGDQWDTSIPVARILSIAGAVGALTTITNEVLIAYGHVQQVAKMQTTIQVARVLLILAACQFGLPMVAAALVLAEGFALLVNSRALKRTLGVSLRGVLASTWRSALVTAASSAGPLALVLTMPNEHPILILALGGLAALAGWIGAIYWTAHPAMKHAEQARHWLRARLARA